MRRALIASALVLSLAGCDETNVTGPDGNPDPLGRTGYIQINVDCDASGRSPLVCRATTACRGLYAFCPGFTPGDVTAAVEWFSDNPGVARVVERGTITAVAPGDTVIGVRSQTVAGQSLVGADSTISVFSDFAIFPTRDISGSVFQAGMLPLQGAIRGAVVEMIDGRLVGRTATTGSPATPPPGFFTFGCTSDAQYCFHAVPPGTYRLRASAQGYLVEEREVTVTSAGSRIVDFQMRPRSGPPPSGL
jgi:hypothetical protein